MALATPASLSFALGLWQWLVARKFPLHQRIAGTGFAPAISILKPLKGCDATTAESLRSWFNQNYSGAVQVLFGVADVGDPVCEIVRRLISEYPQRDARLIVCEKLAGTNAKAAKLVQLEKLARHELILIGDADVRVPPDFLANIVAPFDAAKSGGSPPAAGAGGVTRPTIGLVSCFYRLANPTTTAMRWEAIAINADFWSHVLQSQTLKPLDFALGAAMLVPRAALAEIGGFNSLADCLADDYQLGQRIARKGHRIALCPVVVECWHAPMIWGEVWRHQLRWARTIRVCQPLPYIFSILSNATLWPLLWLVWGLLQTTICNSQSGLGPGFGFIALGGIQFHKATIIALIYVLARIRLAQNLQRLLAPDRDLVSPFWLVPVKDLLQAALWLGAFLGNTVEWRGRKMELRRDGTLAGEK